MRTRLLVAAFAILGAFAASARASYYVPKVGQACRTNYRREVVRIRERHHGHLVRRHGRLVYVRQARCVYVEPVPPVTSPTPVPTLTPVVRATIDPAYTQNTSDNLRVTWSYSASDTSGDLPTGTLALSVQEPNAAGSSGGCSMDVGGTLTGGTCTQELPHYGDWAVTVTYAGASITVAPATSTEIEDIEPLPRAPVAPIATTTSLSVTTYTPYTEQGPPPLDWLYYYGEAGMNITSSDPSNAGVVLSLTIGDSNGSSRTITGSATPTADGCALLFAKTIGYNVDPSTSISGCGIPPTALASGDELSASVTSTASDGYLPSTSPTVAVPPPWTL